MDGNDWFNIFECSNEFWQVRNRQIALSTNCYGMDEYLHLMFNLMIITLPWLEYNAG